MSGRKYEVNLSRSAERMLLQHTEFLAQVNPAAARRLISSLKKVKSRLSDNALLLMILLNLVGCTITRTTIVDGVKYYGSGNSGSDTSSYDALRK
jgi:hypothetical protein